MTVALRKLRKVRFLLTFLGTYSKAHRIREWNITFQTVISWRKKTHHENDNLEYNVNLKWRWSCLQVSLYCSTFINYLWSGRMDDYTTWFYLPPQLRLQFKFHLSNHACIHYLFLYSVVSTKLIEEEVSCKSMNQLM